MVSCLFGFCGWVLGGCGFWWWLWWWVSVVVCVGWVGCEFFSRVWVLTDVVGWWFWWAVGCEFGLGYLLVIGCLCCLRTFCVLSWLIAGCWFDCIVWGCWY